MRAPQTRGPPHLADLVAHARLRSDLIEFRATDWMHGVHWFFHGGTGTTPRA